MVLVNHVFLDFPAAILTIRTHDPPAHAGIQLEVKVARNITLLNAAAISPQLGQIRAQRRENKLPLIYDE